MSKQLVCQRYIYKIHSARLRKEKWRLTLTIEDARRNDEVISLADSQVLRWIDSLNGISDADTRASAIKGWIKEIRKEPYCIQNRRKIRQLYNELDSIQFKPDYLCLIIDKEKDYYRACRGFTVNGVKYRRLLGTNGGIKNSTIVFVSERLHDELDRRINNGRNPEKELVTAKLEAYKALTCSASTPVSMPHGVAVVDDVMTKFISDIVYLSDEAAGEPVMEDRKDQEIEINASDGFGMMLPSLSDRWSGELGLDYMTSGVNTRFSFEKGMVFTFDFVEFVREYADSYFIRDAWGDMVDVREVELILTTSMVKLWDSYDSCADYISNSLSNGYTFAVAKTCARELENLRSLNYQFIQSYHLDDDDIEELIAPTVNRIKDALGGDWKKMVLFLKGSGINDRNVDRMDDDIVKAVMIDPEVANDPYIQSVVYQAIHTRINEAKAGVLDVHGNFSIVSGDPFSLCQHMCGLEVTGLLKAGQIYNRYWAESGSKKIACFRAPMTCHNNIRMVEPVDTPDVNHWFQYMNACTVFNSWDTASNALNGMDYDGDLVMLTDNPVLVRKLEPLPALMCAQRKAKKKVPTEDDFIASNIESFGNDIGQTTNWITSMFEVQSRFEPGSEAYEVLDYRIRCGQLYQQNAIDKAKGIICKPMPKTWHDRHAASKIDNEEERNLYRNIVADKKPYFMRYVYPQLMKQYNEYIRSTEKNAMREFRMTVSELKSIPEKDRTERQSEFLKYYDKCMPVGVGDCVMNKICRRFEQEFDGYLKRHNAETVFDYSVLKNNSTYTESQYKMIRKLYEDYNKRLRNYMIYTSYERIDKAESASEMSVMKEEFRRECDIYCMDSEVLCNIILDLCYSKNTTRRFAWDICGHDIIAGLLDRNNHIINYPVLDPSGDIEYCGEHYTLKSKEIGV